MKLPLFRRNPFLLFTVLALGLLASCKKDDETASVEALKDSAVLYSREIYLWYDQIPANFNGRNYTDLNEVMEAIRQYSRETGYSQPVDRWSFAMKQSEWDDLSSGIAENFGLNVFFKEEGDLRVRLVEPASPAGRAGIRRGWRITKIDGNSNITRSNADFIVNKVYNSTSASFTFQKPDNTTADVTLTAATYQETPALLDTVYTLSGKKIGYFVFNSFLGDSTKVFAAFNRIFNRFVAEGVNDVVVDLRYNGGGYVNIQEKLSNYLAPTSANGQMMLRREYNNKLSQFNITTNFRKSGSLNLNRIFFIVSNNTASASEALINSLKPFMNVVLVGPDKTYGKPVGYFPYPLGDWYIFPVSSRTVNKNGEANYYNGFDVNGKVADGLDKDWGDVTETSLAGALKFITTGSFRLRDADAFVENSQVRQSNEVLSRHDFKGAVENLKIWR